MSSWITSSPLLLATQTSALPVVFLAKSTTLPVGGVAVAPHECYVDNASSFTLSPSLRLFEPDSLRPLKTPFKIRAAAGICTVSWVGKLKCLPSYKGMNVAYFAPTIPATLISLGHLHRCGAHYETDPTTCPTAPRLLLYAWHRGPLLLSAQLTSNNMLPVSVDQLKAHSAAMLASPNVFAALDVTDNETDDDDDDDSSDDDMLLAHVASKKSASFRSVSSKPSVCSKAKAKLSHVTFDKLNEAVQDRVNSPDAPSLSPQARDLATRLASMNKALNPVDLNAQHSAAIRQAMSVYPNAEQRARCDAAEDLHRALHHPSDAHMCAYLRSNPSSGVTIRDVLLNRALRGPCVDCTSGKAVTYRPSSTSPPATAPGQVLSFDLNLLKVPTPLGHTQALKVVDEHAGHMEIVSVKSKSLRDVFDAVMAVVSIYNSYGHKVVLLHGDAENVNRALAPALGSVGIRLVTSTPGSHASRVERYIRTNFEKSTATLAGLSYILPAQYEFFLHRAVAAAMNQIPNSRSQPLSPEEVLTGHRSPIPIPFGTCAMVLQHLDKRESLAKLEGVSSRSVPKAELGVCMGMDPLSRDGLWLLANGKILPRARPSHFLPSHFVPFDWKPKTYSPRVPLPTQAELRKLVFVTDPPPDVANTPVQGTSAIAGDHASTYRMISSSDPAPPLATIRPLPLPSPSLEATNSLATSTSPLLPPTTNTSDVLDADTSLASAVPILPVDSSYSPSVSRVSPTVITVLPAVPTQTLAIPVPLSPLPPRVSTRLRVNRLGSYSNPDTGGAFFCAKAFVAASPAVSYADTVRVGIDGAPQNQRPAVLRKAANHKDHMARVKHFRATQSPFPPGVTNRSCSIVPVPIPSVRSEMPLRKALHVFPEEPLRAALTKEITKHYRTYCSLRSIKPEHVDANAVFLDPQLLVKQKLNGDLSARLPLNGKRQPADTFGETYAGTSTAENRSFILSMGLAYAAANNKLSKSYMGKFDVPAAFLQEILHRSLTGGRQIITRMPHDLPPLTYWDGTPGPLPNELAEVLRTIYGMKQSNAVFTSGFIALMVSHGYESCPSDPLTLFKRCPLDPTDFMHVNMHVDDGSYITTSLHLLCELKSFLTKRYGPDMAYTEHDSGICAVETSVNPDGSVLMHMTKYISDFLHYAGMDSLPAALTPSRVATDGSKFFSRGDSPLLPSDARTQFQRNNGSMIHTLPVRYDIRMEVSHLCSQNQAPTEDDRDKQIHLMRYLKSCVGLGPTFSADPLSYPAGPLITASVDSSHAAHSADGRSHSGYTLTVGTDNAPFLSYSGAESSGIGLSPHDSEYMAFTRCTRQVMYYRQFAAELGYPQHSPTVILEDSRTAINLVTAPSVSRKSRHIQQKEHYCRYCYRLGEIDPQHCGTHDMVPDGLTKTLGPTEFSFFRHRLFRPFSTFKA